MMATVAPSPEQIRGKTCCTRKITSLYSASVSLEPDKIRFHFHVPGENVIRLEGTVLEVLRAQTLFRVELENGHRLLGHVSARRRVEAAELKPGSRVNLMMTAFDFSKGRIVLEERQK